MYWNWAKITAGARRVNLSSGCVSSGMFKLLREHQMHCILVQQRTARWPSVQHHHGETGHIPATRGSSVLREELQLNINEHLSFQIHWWMYPFLAGSFALFCLQDGVQRHLLKIIAHFSIWMKGGKIGIPWLKTGFKSALFAQIYLFTLWLFGFEDIFDVVLKVLKYIYLNFISLQNGTMSLFKRDISRHILYYYEYLRATFLFSVQHCN